MQLKKTFLSMNQLSENFDVIIATYNRPQRVIALVKQVNKCNLTPASIIVVDSSDQDNEEVQLLPNVVYVHSSHKNQPYQRLLGAKLSRSTYVVYLDDDLTITDSQIFNYILKQYQNESVVGVTVGIDYHNSISNKIDGPIVKTNNKLVQLFWKFTGVPFPATGKIGRFGVPGKLPTETGKVQYFYGPVMSFQSKLIDQLISYDLIAANELKVSMGEDKIISMKANNYGILIIDPSICLYHPALESTYFDDIYSFYSKSTFSRLYLNKIYTGVFNKFVFPLNLDYYWFSGWRLILAFFAMLAKYSEPRREKLKGIASGILRTFKKSQVTKLLVKDYNWPQELQHDVDRAIA
jgi:glycosyltransferase involved in cell wall biosynthesis